MKFLITISFALTCSLGFSQWTPVFQKISTPYQWRAGIYDSSLTLPRVKMHNTGDGSISYNPLTRKLEYKTDTGWTTVGSGSDTVINNIYHGSIAGLRALNNPAVKVAYVTDHGTGTFTQDETDSTSQDNTWETVVAASGKRYKRQWDGLTVKMDWFLGPGITDTSDIATYLQAAMNAAFQKKLQFTRERVYRSGQVFLPSGIDIDVNGAILKPSLSPQTDKGIFTYSPLKNDPVTGLYTGSNQPVTAPGKKLAGKVWIHGGRADLEHTLMYFASSDFTNTKNTIADGIEVTDMDIVNLSRSALRVSNDQLFNDSSAVVNNVIFSGNSVKYNIGDGLYVTQNQSIGDTLINIQTIDKEPIAQRLMRGKDIQFGYKGTSGLDVTGYETSNAYFKIIDYTIDANDSSKAVIKIYGGAYDNTNGWIINTDYKGLRANIVKNAMVMPIYQEGGALLFSHPNYSGSLGATTLTRSQSSTQQSAYQKNVIAGMQFSIDGSGTYTVTDVYADSIHITPALKTSVSDKAMQAHYFSSAAVAIYGYIKNTKILNNESDGGDHFVLLVGAGKKNTYAEDIDNRAYINDNKASRAWILVEAVVGSSVRTSYTSVLNGISFTEGDTSFTPSTASRIGTKDMGSGSVKFITLAATTDGNVTNINSLFVGDIVGFAGLNERYIVNDVYLDGSDPTISLRRWDQASRSIVDGGVEVTRSNTGNCYRVFNKELGAMGVFNYIEAKRNVLSYPMRNTGGSGYCLSMGAHEIVSEANTFNVSEVNPIELHGDIVRVTSSNKINAEQFDGSKIVPGLTKTGSGTGKGYGFGTLVGPDITIKDNIFTGSQPSGYYSRSGSFLIQPDSYTLYPLKSLVIQHNTLDGVVNNVVNIVSSDRQTLNGSSYPVFAYKEQYIVDNIISTLPYSFSNVGIFQNIIGAKYRVSNNTISKRGGKLAGINVLASNEKPNVELVDSTTAYDIRIADNNYDTTAIFNSDYVQNHSGVFWNDNPVTLDRDQLLKRKSLQSPKMFDLPGTGMYIRIDTTTGEVIRIQGIVRPFVNTYVLAGTGADFDTSNAMRFVRNLGYVGTGNGTFTPTYSLETRIDSTVSSTTRQLIYNNKKSGTRNVYTDWRDGNNEGVSMVYNGSYGELSTNAAKAFYFSTDGTRRMAISSGGNIGFGNLSPQETVSIGSAGNPGVFALYDNSGNKVLFKAPASIFSNFSTIMPSVKPSVGQVLKVTNVTGNDVTVEYGSDNTGGGGGSGSIEFIE